MNAQSHAHKHTFIAPPNPRVYALRAVFILCMRPGSGGVTGQKQGRELEKKKRVGGGGRGGNEDEAANGKIPLARPHLQPQPVEQRVSVSSAGVGNCRCAAVRARFELLKRPLAQHLRRVLAERANDV